MTGSSGKREKIGFTVHEAKTHFSKLLRMVEMGEEVIIARGSQPLARLVPYERPLVPRIPGEFRGHIRIAPDFDRLPEDILRDFEGDGEGESRR